ncbi:multicopper oxidase MmcO (plasmid) [Antarctobacter heliothermus]|uniref:Multicopper oxidase MmcO n=1 Tax=Antarctobacter heliothermus TaxID=74033 RepID=A0A222EB63_9RHOB|nr:multicopper oxidase family protein [Antarctobacter heliothermus]ASP23436.1 multicopper oxidase MmcO [Antarctobacter heliothermus]MBT52196.1 copper oxidase [Mameliella sp.]
MKYTRRTFLALTGASAGLGLPRRGFALGDATPLVTREASLQLLPEGYPQTRIWGYDGAIPGTEIRVPQGARVQRQLVNDLPEATSVHWHGIRIDNAMDGVSGLTQDPVPPGASFDYDFIVPDAGTYWYHAHNRSFEQVARGLRGALIVEEPQVPDVDRDEVLILDDWLINPETGQIADNFDQPMMMSHGGRTGNYVTTNGQYKLTVKARQNDRLRLRLINAANARIFALRLQGMAGWTVALDGMPLAEPQPIADTLLLGPAQRIDLFVDISAAPGETAALLNVETDEPFPQVAFAVAGQGASVSRAAPLPLPPNPRMDAPDLATAAPFKLFMSGGAMGRMDSAVLHGERKGFRQLAGAGYFWALNDVVNMPDTPLAKVSLGTHVRLSIINDTVFPHAMHLHGMHFREVTNRQTGPMRDTLLIGAGETRKIAFVADNPGKWLFHCHMLEHAVSGMTTWVEVA